ncbi:MAG TPA: hypothetical protein VHL77_06165 [Ferruginibacter sp.]|jgi:hypothetical protein|nr:hypothetical protein [Ferruginibacter sp.]
MDIILNASHLTIQPVTGNAFEVQLEGVQVSEVLDHFKLSDFINHLNENDFLEAIGADACKRYFDLIDKE